MDRHVIYTVYLSCFQVSQLFLFFFIVSKTCLETELPDKATSLTSENTTSKKTTWIG